MRIPRFDIAGVTPQAEVTTAQPNLQAPNQGFVQALGAVNQTLGQVAGLVRREEQEADEAVINNGLAELEKAESGVMDGVDGQPGFLNSRGVGASAEMSKAMGAIEKRRQSIMSGLQPHQRMEFERRSLSRMASTQRVAQRHTVLEVERAKVESAAALQEGTLRSVAMSERSGDNTGVSEKTAEVENSIRRMARSPEAAAESVNAWRSAVVAQRVAVRLEQEDVAGAEAMLGDAGLEMDASVRDKLKAQVAFARKKLDAKTDKAMAIKEVDAIVSGAMDDNWVLNETKARGRFEILSPEKQDKLRDLFHAQLMEADKRRTAFIEDIKARAQRAWNAKGISGISGDIEAELQRYAPEKLTAFREDHQKRVERWERKTKPGDGNDKEALWAFRALPPEERGSVDVGEWVTGRGVSDEMREHLRAEQRTSIESLKKAGANDERAFRSELQRTISERGIYPKTKGARPLSQYPKEELESDAMSAYQNFVQEKGRAPNAQEKLELLTPFVKQDVLVEKGLLWDSKTPTIGYDVMRKTGKPETTGQTPISPSPLPATQAPSSQESRPANLVDVREKVAVVFTNGRVLEVAPAVADKLIKDGRARKP